MTATILSLLIFSALAEMFGTLTVWQNYNNGAQLATRLLQKVEAQDLLDTQFKNTYGFDPKIVLTYEGQNHVIVDSAAELRQLRLDVGSHLQRNWFITAGLVSYVVGALTGLAAGLIAIFR